ncbi:MAG: outer membrane beta-barrel protein [Xanthobacteraceae bacterium]
MHRFIKFISAIAAAAALVTTPALAADLLVKASPPPPPPMFSWTGFYLGVQGGGGWSNSSATENDSYFCPAGGACAAPTPVVPGIPMSSTSASGAFGGITAGFNYQINAVVVGIEGDWSGAGINGSGACNTAFITPSFGAGATGTCGNNLRDFATLTGRLGWAAWDRALIYVKGGAAWANYNDTVTTTVAGIPGPSANFTNNRSGWTFGAGVEYALTPAWSVKLEYDHMDFGTQNVTYPFTNVPPFAAGTFNTVASQSQRVDIVRAGINYRFNIGGGPMGGPY